MLAGANDAVRMTGSPAASEASRSTLAMIAKSRMAFRVSMTWRTVQVRGAVGHSVPVDHQQLWATGPAVRRP